MLLEHLQWEHKDGSIRGIVCADIYNPTRIHLCHYSEDDTYFIRDYLKGRVYNDLSLLEAQAVLFGILEQVRGKHERL
jgi:hypothetical protein